MFIYLDLIYLSSCISDCNDLSWFKTCCIHLSWFKSGFIYLSSFKPCCVSLTEFKTHCIYVGLSLREDGCNWLGLSQIPFKCPCLFSCFDLSQFAFICHDLYLFSKCKPCCIYLSWFKPGCGFCHDLSQVVFSCLDLGQDVHIGLDLRHLCTLVVHVSQILRIQGHSYAMNVGSSFYSGLSAKKHSLLV